LSDQRAPIPTRVRIGLTTLAGIALYGIGVATAMPYGRTPLLDVSDAIMLAVLVALGGFVAQLYSRIGTVEAKLTQAEDYNRSLWAYCRRLIDLYYRNRRDGAPDPGPLPDEP